MDDYVIVGWVIVNSDGDPKRPETMRRWYDNKPSAGPAKIYATEKVAARYGTAKPVYMKREI